MEPNKFFETPCPEHNHERKMFCLKESIFICADCIGDHENHAILSHKTILEIASNGIVIHELERQRQFLINFKEECIKLENTIM